MTEEGYPKTVPLDPPTDPGSTHSGASLKKEAVAKVATDPRLNRWADVILKDYPAADHWLWVTTASDYELEQWARRVSGEWRFDDRLKTPTGTYTLLDDPPRKRKRRAGVSGRRDVNLVVRPFSTES